MTKTERCYDCGCRVFVTSGFLTQNPVMGLVFVCVDCDIESGSLGWIAAVKEDGTIVRKVDLR